MVIMTTTTATSISQKLNSDRRRSSLQIVASDKEWKQKNESDTSISNKISTVEDKDNDTIDDNTTESLSLNHSDNQTLTIVSTIDLNTLKIAILHALCVSALYTIQFIYMAYIAQLTFFNNLGHRWQSYKFDSTRQLSMFFGLLSLSTTSEEKQHRQSNDIVSLLNDDKTRLTKIPQHLAITLSSELLFERTDADWSRIVDDLCRVSCWAWEMGIKEISVYEASGVLKSMAVDIYKQQSKVLHEWKQQHHPTSLSVTENDFGFLVLSLEDAQSQLVEATQKSFKHINNNHEKVSSINIDLVDKFMNETMSDPELMVVYDGLPHRYISLDGYPPWHIRLTEFINATAHHRFDYTLFSSCLYKYSKVEQRLGR